MIRQRVCIGRDVRVVSEEAGGIELEGRPRLRPGRDVEVVMMAAGGATSRQAQVWSWRVIAVGLEGPTFRGVCRWP